jgi:hypothetical protein
MPTKVVAQLSLVESTNTDRRMISRENRQRTRTISIDNLYNSVVFRDLLIAATISPVQSPSTWTGLVFDPRTEGFSSAYLYAMLERVRS